MSKETKEYLSMSYDLNVLCVNQKTALSLPFVSSIELRNEFDFPASGRYHSIWPFMSNMNGIWYSLGKDGESGFNALPIIDSDFDKEIDRLAMPYWLSDDNDYDNIKSNMTPLIISDKYKEDFKNIIQFLVRQSSDSVIMFLARYQGGEKEIVQGTMAYGKFEQLLGQFRIFVISSVFSLPSFDLGL
jgi:hypothetical protein